MLCPEVWNLKAPNNSVYFQSGDYEAKSITYVNNVIRNHHFNQMISLILPNCSGSIPDDIVKLFNDSDYYRVDNFNLKELLSREFIEGFVRKGKLTALSWNTRNDIENCFSITPDGKLLLSIDKDLYQSLGIEGEKVKGNHFKNNVIIDLKHPDMHKGRSFFERINRAMSNEAFSCVSLQCTWDPPDSSICPSSIAKFFNTRNYTVKVCHAKSKVHTERLLRCPKFKPGNNINKPHELVEYLGMRMLSCDIGESEPLNSYCENSECDEIKEAKVIHSKGFFSTSFICRLVTELRKTVCDPWSALCVNGVEFSPLTFFNRQHTVTTNGDNDYILLIYANKKYLLYLNSSSNKKPM